MKLKNKETGEIGELQITEKHCAVVVGNGTANCVAEIYSSLANLNEKWEDAPEEDAPEEPKEFWFVDADGEVRETNYLSDNDKSSLRSFGNYFETKEEAEKTVKKLKAWKRLRDKGISFEAKVIDGKWYLTPKAEPQQRTFDEAHDVFKDIMFIFGGEE